jgi:hypothetical protein
MPGFDFFWDGESLRIDAAEAGAIGFGMDPAWENLSTITEKGLSWCLGSGRGPRKFKRQLWHLLRRSLI